MVEVCSVCDRMRYTQLSTCLVDCTHSVTFSVFISIPFVFEIPNLYSTFVFMLPMIFKSLVDCMHGNMCCVCILGIHHSGDVLFAVLLLWAILLSSFNSMLFKVVSTMM